MYLHTVETDLPRLTKRKPAIEKERDTLFECASRWQPLQLAGKKKKQFLSSPSPLFQLRRQLTEL
jgi:hypothetical protein